MKTLAKLFEDELSDVYDAERRIVKALPKCIKAATCTKLKQVFENHLAETKGHVLKVERVFRSIHRKAKGKTCKATIGLLKEAAEVIAEFKGSPAINAALISSAQKIEHYEMASYGCLHEWSLLLGYTDATPLLEEILLEEKAANQVLTERAISSNNEEALPDECQILFPGRKNHSD